MKQTDKEQSSVQAKPLSSDFSGGTAIPSAVGEAQLSSGRPMDRSTRSFMESSFGHDFGGVRVHSDDAAAFGAAAIHARAYTIGSHVFFGSGQYSPSTLDGKRLLAHELTHVLQQSGSGVVQVQRKTLDKCDEGKQSGSPCASWITPVQVARLKPFAARAREDFAGSKSLNVVTGILGASLDTVEKAQLVRVACCQLNAEDAKTALESFGNRSGVAGRIFGNFATATRCDLLAILKERATSAPQPAQPASGSMDVASAIKQAIGGPRDKDVNRVARKAFEASAGFNLRDAATLRLATDTVSEVAGPIAIVHYLEFVDQSLGRRKVDEPQRDPFEPLRVRRRGPYGTYGGVGAPVLLGGIAAPFAWLMYFAENVRAFLKGVYYGLKESVTEEAAEDFGKRLAGSVVLTLVFPPPFLAGLGVGLAEMVKGFVESIINIKETIKAIVELLGTMFTPDGYAFAKAMGHAFGIEFGQKIVDMSQMGLIRFTYNLGKMVGPAILFAVLTLLGVPEAAGAAMSARILEILGPVAKRFPRLAKLVGKLTRKAERVEKAEAAIGGAEGKVAHAAEKDAAKAKQLAAAAAEDAPLAPPRKGKGGHEVHVEHDGPHVCSPPPCPLLEVAYKVELKTRPALQQRLKEIKDLRATNPAEATRLSAELQGELETLRVNRIATTKHVETVEEFEKAGGKVKGRDDQGKPKPAPTPKNAPKDVTAAPKADPGMPAGYEDMPHSGSRTAKQTGDVAEDHHLASKYVQENRDIFKKAGMSINSDLNFKKGFRDHGELRGWYDWSDKKFNFKYDYKMKGHHPDYNKWVTDMLREATPAGIRPEEAVKRIARVLEKVDAILEEHPEVLSHGPQILKEKAKLSFDWN
jgi:hypothetical protein